MSFCRLVDGPSSITVGKSSQNVRRGKGEGGGPDRKKQIRLAQAQSSRPTMQNSIITQSRLTSHGPPGLIREPRGFLFHAIGPLYDPRLCAPDCVGEVALRAAGDLPIQLCPPAFSLFPQALG